MNEITADVIMAMFRRYAGNAETYDNQAQDLKLTPRIIACVMADLYNRHQPIIEEVMADKFFSAVKELKKE